jgi:hypothetical protein
MIIPNIYYINFLQCLCKLVSIEQNSTTQNKVEDIKQILSCTMFNRRNIILVFYTTCVENKKLSHSL